MSDLEPQSQPAWNGPTPPGEPPGIAVAVEEPRDPFWGWVDVAVFLGLLFFSVLVSAGIAQFGAHSGILRGLSASHAMIIAQFVAFTLTCLALWGWLETRYGPVPFWKSLGWRLDRWLIVPSFVSGMLLAVVVSLVNVALRTKPVKNDIEQLMREPTIGPILALLGVTLAPFFEELFFRGFIQPLLVRSLGILAGVGLSGFLFALVHGPRYHWAWQYIVSVMLAGIAFAALRQRSGSTALSAIMHSGYNFTFFAVFFLFQQGTV